MVDEIVKNILFLVAGALIALITSRFKSKLDRETAMSNDLFKQRIQSLNAIWLSFLPLRTTLAKKVQMRHDVWEKENQKNALKDLDVFRARVDENQVILPCSVIVALREIDTYLFGVLENGNQKPSDYEAKLKELRGTLTAVVQKTFTRRTHAINLEFHT